MTGAALPLPDPPLAAGAAVLRPWAPEDAPALAAAWADPEVARWTGVPERHDEAAARHWIEGDARRRERGLSLDLVIEADGQVAGEVGLAAFDPRTRRAEVGWWVAPSHRRRHLARDAVASVSAWATEELDLEVLVARCHRGNPASQGVARSAGFTELPTPAEHGLPVGPDEVVWVFALDG